MRGRLDRTSLLQRVVHLNKLITQTSHLCKRRLRYPDNYGYHAEGYKHGSPTKKGEKAIEYQGVNWLGGGVGGNNAGVKYNNRPGEYDVKSKRQGFLQSSLDDHGQLPDRERALQEKRDADHEYQQKNQYNIPSKSAP